MAAREACTVRARGFLVVPQQTHRPPKRIVHGERHAAGPRQRVADRTRVAAGIRTRRRQAQWERRRLVHATGRERRGESLPIDVAAGDVRVREVQPRAAAHGQVDRGGAGIDTPRARIGRHPSDMK